VPPAASRTRRPAVIAHRGGGREVPENTWSAVEHVAVAEGALSVTDHAELEHARALVKDASSPERKAMAKRGVKRLEASHRANTFTLAEQLESLTGLEARVSILGYVQRGGAPRTSAKILPGKADNETHEILSFLFCRIISITRTISKKIDNRSTAGRKSTWQGIVAILQSGRRCPGKSAVKPVKSAMEILIPSLTCGSQKKRITASTARTTLTPITASLVQWQSIQLPSGFMPQTWNIVFGAPQSAALSATIAMSQSMSPLFFF